MWAIDFPWKLWRKLRLEPSSSPSSSTNSKTNNNVEEDMQERIKKISDIKKGLKRRKRPPTKSRYRKTRNDIEAVTETLRDFDPSVVTQIYTLEQYSVTLEQYFQLVYDLTAKNFDLIQEVIEVKTADVKAAQQERNTAYKYMKYAASITVFMLLYWLWQFFIKTQLGIDIPIP